MRQIMRIAGALALAGGLVLPVGAQETTEHLPSVEINGQRVLTIRVGAGGLTPEERADVVRQRLGPILTMPDLKAEDIWIKQERRGQTAAIYVRDRLLITVDRSLAKANDTMPLPLARIWANNLRETLPEIDVTVR
ncbi:MAG: hypothetical protein ACK47B_15570 [Armatimonadota bacterium]